MSGIRVAQVSDISVGYGNFDALAMLQSLMEYYDADGAVIEPDQTDRPLMADQPRLRILRIPTFHQHEKLEGRIEFISRAAEIVNAMRPELLIIRSSYAIPTLFKLQYRPKYVLYHAMETINGYGEFDTVMNSSIVSRKIDLIAYPEENRAVQDMRRCGFNDVPLVITYNCAVSPTRDTTICPPSERNGRVLYFGALHHKMTFTRYYANPKMNGMLIDLFGYLPWGEADRKETEASLKLLPPSIRYIGYVDLKQLELMRKQYAYSLVMWDPVSDNHLYAAPCKFFESIIDGIPVITAPHPQCKMITERYNCGIVMEDWSFDSFYDSLKTAMALYGTQAYSDMVEGCRRAVAQELTWDKQFAKVKPFLREIKPCRQ